MTDIKPALTKERWAVETDPQWTSVDQRMEWASKEAGVEERLPRHGLAALALYNQPFGFTREDVKQLRDHRAMLMSVQESEHGSSWARFIASLTDRIAALLPPEDKATLVNFSASELLNSDDLYDVSFDGKGRSND